MAKVATSTGNQDTKTEPGKSEKSAGKSPYSGHTLAYILDVVKDDRADFIMDEVHRLRLICHVIDEKAYPVTYRQHSFRISELAAVYLPQIVERFIQLSIPLPNIPTHLQKHMLLDNAYLRMIAEIKETPYFFKYLRSKKPISHNNRALLRVIAERLADVGYTWTEWFDHPPKDGVIPEYKGTAAFLIQMLADLLMAYSDEVPEVLLPQGIRKSLQRLCIVWSYKAHVSGHQELGRSNSALASFLFNNFAHFPMGEYITPLANLIRKELGGRKECAFLDCEEKGVQSLKACSKCQVVRYV